MSCALRFPRNKNISCSVFATENRKSVWHVGKQFNELFFQIVKCSDWKSLNLKKRLTDQLNGLNYQGYFNASYGTKWMNLYRRPKTLHITTFGQFKRPLHDTTNDKSFELIKYPDISVFRFKCLKLMYKEGQNFKLPFHMQVTELVKHLSVRRQHALSENVRWLLWGRNRGEAVPQQASYRCWLMADKRTLIITQQFNLSANRDRKCAKWNTSKHKT